MCHSEQSEQSVQCSQGNAVNSVVNLLKSFQYSLFIAAIKLVWNSCSEQFSSEQSKQPVKFRIAHSEKSVQNIQFRTVIQKSPSEPSVQNSPSEPLVHNNSQFRTVSSVYCVVWTLLSPEAGPRRRRPLSAPYSPSYPWWSSETNTNKQQQITCLAVQRLAVWQGKSSNPNPNPAHTKSIQNTIERQ